MEILKPEKENTKWYQGVSLEDAEIYIHSNLRSIARNIIATGYYLKCIRDGELYREAGYGTIWEYAADRLGFSVSTASRIMSCNDKYSVDGNSPIVAEAYKKFNKSQLMEMLPLGDEQMEQVTPDMTVQQIREVKRQREIPYVELPGQISIADFPGVEPEENTAGAEAEPVTEKLLVQSCEISVEDLMPEPEPLLVESVATSQEETGVLECIASKEMDHSIRKAYCDAFARFLIEHYKDWFRKDYESRVLVVTESEKQLKERFKETWYFRDPIQERNAAHINLFRDYIQIWDGAGRCIGNTEWFYLCVSIQSMWNVIALEDAAKKQQNEEICCENSSEEEIEEIATSQPEEAAEVTDRELLREMLEKEKALLDEMMEVDKAEELPPNMLRKKKLLVRAFAGMLCDLEEPEPEEPEQPELPIMKNNDQRKAWLRDYKSWGLWYTDEHIGARYYKYDFDNGARLIAEVYSNHNQFTGLDYESSYLHLVGGPEPEKHPTGAYGRWQRHETYNRYPDSETELVEFLKAVQKGR
mgnify:CR=1 FL=1